MNLAARFKSWMRAMLRRARTEREMGEEMRFHLEARAADLMRNGVAEPEALRQARLEFGGAETAKDQCRDAVGVTFLETLMWNTRSAIE